MKPALPRRLLLAGLIAVVAGVLPAVALAAAQREKAAHAARDPLPENQYWSLVESSRQAIADLKGASPEKIKGTLDQLTGQWQAVNAVTLTAGETVPIDNSYLVSALTAQKPDPGQIEAMLSSLEAAHQSYPSHVFTNADLASLNDILSRPEFRGLDQPANPFNDWVNSLWTRLLRWFGQLLERLFGARTVSLPGAAISPLEILSFAILIVILFFVARSIFADLTPESRFDDDGDDPDKALTSDRAFEKAQMLSRGGDYRSAVRYLYLSCLLLLDERGLLRYDHSKTNREVLRSVSDSPELAGPLRDVIEVFDRVWYGYHALDDDSFGEYSRRVQALKEQQK